MVFWKTEKIHHLVFLAEIHPLKTLLTDEGVDLKCQYLVY